MQYKHHQNLKEAHSSYTHPQHILQVARQLPNQHHHEYNIQHDDAKKPQDVSSTGRDATPFHPARSSSSRVISTPPLLKEKIILQHAHRLDI